MDGLEAEISEDWSTDFALGRHGWSPGNREVLVLEQGLVGLS